MADGKHRDATTRQITTHAMVDTVVLVEPSW